MCIKRHAFTFLVCRLHYDVLRILEKMQCEVHAVTTMICIITVLLPPRGLHICGRREGLPYSLHYPMVSTQQRVNYSEGHEVTITVSCTLHL